MLNNLLIFGQIIEANKYCKITYFNTIYMIMTQCLWNQYSNFYQGWTFAARCRQRLLIGCWRSQLRCTGIIVHHTQTHVMHRYYHTHVVDAMHCTQTQTDICCQWSLTFQKWAWPCRTADTCGWRSNLKIQTTNTVLCSDQTSHQNSVYGMYIICVTRVSAVSAPHPPK